MKNEIPENGHAIYFKVNSFSYCLGGEHENTVRFLALKLDSVLFSFSLSVGANDALSDLNAAAWLSARHCSTIYCLFSVALLDLRSILLTAETVVFFYP